MKKIILATNNMGKAQEMALMFQADNITIIAQSLLNITAIEETGLTFVENALLKARHAAKVSGLPAIADDSGLVVNALQGAPGIYSARYAGRQANDQDNIKKLLQDMQTIPEHQRQAYFYCTLVYLKHSNDPTPLICQGKWSGYIAHTATGNNGFGYDPVFWLPEKQCSAAQLSKEEKNKLSHRGQALRQLIHYLKNDDHNI